jgi:hypothetical protein
VRPERPSGMRLYTNGLFDWNIRLDGRPGYATDRDEDMGVAVRVHRVRPLLAGR